MLKYVAARVGVLIPLLFGLSILVFLYIHVIPGNPVAGMLGPAGTPSLIAQLSRQFGLDQPLPVQYWHWLDGIFHGNLGTSFISREAIGPILASRAPASLELTVAGMLAVVVIGWPLGFLAGLYKDSWIDHVVSSLAGLGLAVPQFWLGTLFILVFAVTFRWLPAEGYVAFRVDPAQNLRYLAMPALVLGLSLSPYLIRMTRAATIEVQQELFVRQAGAKGLKRSTIVRRYIARNAILPIVVVLGLQLGALIGGQVIVEEVFGWPGLGQLLVTAVTQRDYFMIQAVILVIAVFYSLIYLSTEVAQAVLDPRLRL